MATWDNAKTGNTVSKTKRPNELGLSIGKNEIQQLLGP